MRRVICAFILLFLPAGGRGEEKDAPTPAEQVAKLRETLSREHEKLGSWAAGKKLGRMAEAHLLLAIAADPENRNARRKLGHDRDNDGNWAPGRREPEWAYGHGAQEKHGKEFEEREREVFATVVRETTRLGIALRESAPDLSRRLLRRAVLLDPGHTEAVDALGLVPLVHGVGWPKVKEAVTTTPEIVSDSVTGVQNAYLRLKTVAKQCGSVIAETAGDAGAATTLARICHQAQVLTSLRFGLAPAPTGWATVSVAEGHETYSALLDRSGAFDANRLAISKAVGTARSLSPRHFLATWTGNAGDPGSVGPVLVHMIAENTLYWHSGKELPAWLLEAVGMDAVLTLLDRPGPLCITYEASQGLTARKGLDQAASWNERLLRNAAAGDLSKLAYLVRAQIQALGEDDILAAHLYYRYFLLVHPDGLPKFLSPYLRREGEVVPEDAIAEAFGGTPDEVEAELLDLYLGR